MTPRVREQAFLVGPRKSLVGILTESDAPAAGCPAVLILNAGIIHRVGPSRMNVLLARALAASGYTVLRFDLSGLGDSEQRADGLAPLDAAIADVRDAIDWLEATRRVQRVVLAGLCSGANLALVYGAKDPRVAGLVLLDPATPKTMGYYLRHFMPRLFRPSVWLNLLRGRHPLVRGLARRMVGNRDAVEGPRRIDAQDPEVRAVLEQAYRDALARDIRFLAVFTGSLEDKHNYAGQLLDAFPKVDFGDRIRLEYFQYAEHTFTAEVDRARLARVVLAWIDAAGLAKPAAQA